jgi:hypothetical protein
MFQKLDEFSSSGKGKENRSFLDPLERANLNHWTSFKYIFSFV